MSDTSHGMTEEEFERIAALITSDSSPVGIDAKTTHVIIIHKLEAIERRLSALESRRSDASLPDATTGANPSDESRK